MGRTAMRVMEKGVVTIPKAIREQANIAVGDEVQFSVRSAVVQLRRKAEGVRSLRGNIDRPPASIDRLIAELRGKRRLVRKRMA